MAASAPSPLGPPVGPPASASELLLCDICLEAYNERSRPPKFLACYHSFCQPCLEQVAASNTNGITTRLECPACRKLMMLPPGGVGQLQTNFYITHMQEALHQMSVVAETTTTKARLCHRHSNQPMSFFCRTCCVPICRDCTILDHRAESDEHKIQDIKAAEGEQRQGLVGQVKASRVAIANIDMQVKRIDTEMSNLGVAKDAALRDIEAAFASYHQMLDVRKSELMNSTMDMYNIQEVDLKECSKKLSGSLTKLSTSLSTGERIATTSRHLSEVIKTKLELQSSTDELKQVVDSIEIGLNYLKCDSEHGLETFKREISKLGKVSATSDLPSRIEYDIGDLTASRPCSFTIQVFGYNASGCLVNYPIDILIYDSTDTVIPSQISPTDAGYSISFVPQISGEHKIVPLFLGEPITGADTTTIVRANNPVLKVGGLGAGEGKFCCPRAIACDREGFLYVADTGNKLIQKFDKDGRFMHQFKISAGSEDCSTCDLALNHRKGLIVCTETMVGSSVNPTMGNTVATYTTDGRLKHKFCNKVMKCALCVATNSHSEIIISDYLVHSLFMYDEHGNFLRRIGSANAFNHPAFICIGENDSVIVSDTNNDVIQIFDRQGQFLHQFGKSGSSKGCLKQPFGVADDGENILVVDSGNKRIQVFSREGKFVSMIESSDDPLNQPRGMVLTNDGHVWVADRDSNCIKKYCYK